MWFLFALPIAVAGGYLAELLLGYTLVQIAECLSILGPLLLLIAGMVVEFASETIVRVFHLDSGQNSRRTSRSAEPRKRLGLVNASTDRRR